MDRRSFLSNMSAATVASIAGAATLSDKADALEDAMSDELDKRIATPWFCNIDPTPEPVAGDTRPCTCMTIPVCLKCQRHLP